MEDLESEDLRQQRRFRTVAICTAIVMVVLATVTYLAQRSSHISGMAAASANRVADSRRMAAKASELLGEHGDLNQAMLLGVLAWRLSPTQESADVLDKLASSSSDVARVLGQHAAGGTWIKGFTVATDGSPLLATIDSGGTLMFWHVPDATPAGRPVLMLQGNDAHLLFSRDGSRLLSFNRSIREANSVSVTDLRSGVSQSLPVARLPAQFTGDDMIAGHAGFSPSGRFVAMPGFLPGANLSQRTSVVAVWDTSSGSLSIAPMHLQPNTSIDAMTWTDDDHLLFVTHSNQNRAAGPCAGVWTRSPGQVQLGSRTGEPEGDVIGAFAAFSNDASRVAFWYHNNLAVYARDASLNLHATSLAEYASLNRPYIDDVSFSADSNRVAVGLGEHDSAAVWDLEHGTLLKRLPHTSAVRLSLDGRWFAAQYGSILLYDLNAGGKQAAALQADCTPTNSGDGRCIQQLCAKAEPMLRSDQTLRQLLGDTEVDRLKRLALDRPCLGEIGA